MPNLPFFVAIATTYVALSTPAYADVPSWIPFSDINIRVRFENLDDYPEYDFYLKYGLGRGNPYAGLHVTKVPAAATIRLEGTGSRMTDVYLMAVPRGQPMPPVPDWAKERDWLTESPPGGMVSGALRENSRLLHEAGYGIEVVYRVDIEDNRLIAVWLTTHSPYFVLLIAVGIGSTVLIGVLLWWRRSRRALLANPSHPKPNSP